MINDDVRNDDYYGDFMVIMMITIMIVTVTALKGAFLFVDSLLTHAYAACVGCMTQLCATRRFGLLFRRDSC